MTSVLYSRKVRFRDVYELQQRFCYINARSNFIQFAIYNPSVFVNKNSSPYTGEPLI